MKTSRYKKLEVDLPQAPQPNSKRWLIAGWALVLLFLGIAAYCYWRAGK